MEKEIQGKRVLFTRHVLKSPMEIGAFAEKDEPMLRAKASELDLDVTGPLEHAYWDMAVKGVPHILEIWLPVDGKAESRDIDGLKRVEAYKCLSADFRRPIEEIGDAWGELGGKAKSLGYTLTNHDREVYKVMDCDQPEKNDIELQIGIG